MSLEKQQQHSFALILQQVSQLLFLNRIDLAKKFLATDISFPVAEQEAAETQASCSWAAITKQVPARSYSHLPLAQSLAQLARCQDAQVLLMQFFQITGITIARLPEEFFFKICEATSATEEVPISGLLARIKFLDWLNRLAHQAGESERLLQAMPSFIAWFAALRQQLACRKYQALNLDQEKEAYEQLVKTTYIAKIRILYGNPTYADHTPLGRWRHCNSFQTKMLQLAEQADSLVFEHVERSRQAILEAQKELFAVRRSRQNLLDQCGDWLSRSSLHNSPYFDYWLGKKHRYIDYENDIAFFNGLLNGEKSSFSSGEFIAPIEKKHSLSVLALPIGDVDSGMDGVSIDLPEDLEPRMAEALQQSLQTLNTVVANVQLVFNNALNKLGLTLTLSWSIPKQVEIKRHNAHQRVLQVKIQVSRLASVVNGQQSIIYGNQAIKLEIRHCLLKDNVTVTKQYHCEYSLPFLASQWCFPSDDREPDAVNLTVFNGLRLAQWQEFIGRFSLEERLQLEHFICQFQLELEQHVLQEGIPIEQVTTADFFIRFCQINSDWHQALLMQMPLVQALLQQASTGTQSLWQSWQQLNAFYCCHWAYAKAQGIIIDELPQCTTNFDRLAELCEQAPTVMRQVLYDEPQRTLLLNHASLASLISLFVKYYGTQYSEAMSGQLLFRQRLQALPVGEYARQLVAHPQPLARLIQLGYRVKIEQNREAFIASLRVQLEECQQQDAWRAHECRDNLRHYFLADCQLEGLSELLNRHNPSLAAYLR